MQLIHLIFSIIVLRTCISTCCFTIFHSLIGFQCHCIAIYVFMQWNFFTVHGSFASRDTLVATEKLPFQWKSLILMNIMLLCLKGFKC